MDEFEVFFDDETGQTIVVIMDADIGQEEAKTIANRKFKTSKDNLKVVYAKVKSNTVMYDLKREKANAVAVYIERR